MPPGQAASGGITGARNLRGKHGLALDERLPDLLVLVEEACAVPVAVLPHLGGDFAGGYFRKAGRPVILVNAEDPAPRMRFTLAHELGHHYFGHLERLPQLNGRIRDTRAGLRARGGPWWEVQANAFAAELLIPREAVLAWDARRAGGSISLDDVVDLAAGFGVSAMMACIRLETAGVLTDEARGERLKSEISDGEHDDLVAGHAAFDDRLSAARACAPRIPAALGRSKLAALASGRRPPGQVAAQLGYDAKGFADAMDDLALLPPAAE